MLYREVEKRPPAIPKKKNNMLTTVYSWPVKNWPLALSCLLGGSWMQNWYGDFMQPYFHFGVCFPGPGQMERRLVCMMSTCFALCLPSLALLRFLCAREHLGATTSSCVFAVLSEGVNQEAWSTGNYAFPVCKTLYTGASVPTCPHSQGWAEEISQRNTEIPRCAGQVAVVSFSRKWAQESPAQHM